MKRASYREGIAWIALNDEPTAMEVEEVQGQISVLLLADLFGKDEEAVAFDVIAYRAKRGPV